MSDTMAFVPFPVPVPSPNPDRAQPTLAFRAARRGDPRLGPSQSHSRWRDPAEVAREQAAEARHERTRAEADPRTAAILAQREARAEAELAIITGSADEAEPGPDGQAGDLAARRQALARFQAAESRYRREVPA
jgi:hypothetical protein